MNKQAVSLMKYYAAAIAPAEEMADLRLYVEPPIGGMAHIRVGPSSNLWWTSADNAWHTGDDAPVSSTEPFEALFIAQNNERIYVSVHGYRVTVLNRAVSEDAQFTIATTYTAADPSNSVEYLDLLDVKMPLSKWHDKLYFGAGSYIPGAGMTFNDRVDNGSEWLMQQHLPSFGHKMDLGTYNGILRVSAEATGWNNVAHNCGYGGALFADGVVSTIKCTSGAFNRITDIWWPYDTAPANLGLASHTIVHLNYDGSRPYFHYRGGIQITSEIPTLQRQEELRFFDAPLWDRFSDYGTYSPVFFSSWSSPQTGFTTWKDRKCLHVPQGSGVSWRRVNEDFFPQWKDSRTNVGNWSNVTLSCWVCPTQTDATWRRLCLFGASAPRQSVRLATSGTSFYGGCDKVDIQASAMTADNFKQWHHLVCTRQGTSPSVYTFYLDGSKIGESSQTTATSTEWLRQANDGTTVSIPDTARPGDYYISDVEVRGYAMDLAGVQNRLAETKYQDQVLTSIPDNAFRNLSELDWTELPSNLRNATSIGLYAFMGCTKLALSEIPSTVTSIGEGAFASCANVTFSSLPSWMTVIPPGLFSGCAKVTISELPAGCTSLGVFCFAGSSVALSELPSSVTSIGEGAFESCANITLSEIPAGVTIGDEYQQGQGAELFRGCTSITSMDIKSPMTQIGNRMFYGCTSLQTVTLPSTVTAVAGDVFQGCTSLTTVRLQSTPSSIAGDAFTGCPALTDIYVPWSEGAVADAPWGAPSTVQIHYDWVPSQN